VPDLTEDSHILAYQNRKGSKLTETTEANLASQSTSHRRPISQIQASAAILAASHALYLFECFKRFKKPQIQITMSRDGQRSNMSAYSITSDNNSATNANK
jgi:hypothetical protein